MSVTTAQVKAIRSLVECGVRIKVIAERLHIPQTEVFNIAHDYKFHVDDHWTCPKCHRHFITAPCPICDSTEPVIKPDIPPIDSPLLPVLTLELKPEEYQRYLPIRQKKELEQKKIDDDYRNRSGQDWSNSD